MHTASQVVVNKMMVGLVRKEVELPNIVLAFGTSSSADCFVTWKLEYEGCPRYCWSCGVMEHEARDRECTMRGITREELG